MVYKQDKITYLCEVCDSYRSLLKHHLENVK